jgi:CheY-like chemotaxis protein
MLEKMGHTVVIAANGREAVRLWSESSFDLVFMDVQMPEMDGFSATAAIRLQEPVTGKHIPIIAITAHAMKGDRERCLAAGMDGYVAKPLRVEEVEKVLDGQHFVEPLVVSSAKPSGWDSSIALNRMGGDESLLKEIIGIFLEESPNLLMQMQEALLEANPTKLEHSAHSLKGELGYLGMAEASGLALQLEEAGRNRQMADAAQLLAALQHQLSQVRGSMAAVAAVVEPIGPTHDPTPA